MKFERYSESKDFLDDTLEILLEHEAENISMIRSLTLDSKTSLKEFEELLAEKDFEGRDNLLDKLDMILWSHPRRLFAAIKDSKGSILLTAYCNHPYKGLCCSQHAIN